MDKFNNVNRPLHNDAVMMRAIGSASESDNTIRFNDFFERFSIRRIYLQTSCFANGPSDAIFSMTTTGYYGMMGQKLVKKTKT